MQVFGFDLLPYPERLDHLKVDGELPYPLPKRHFRPDLAGQNYRDHLDAWVRMEELGFDGIGFNEHHTSPYRAFLPLSGRRRDHAQLGLRGKIEWAWVHRACDNR